MNSPSSQDEGSAIDALRVLAATASVASDQLREDERSRSSSQAPSSASSGRPRPTARVNVRASPGEDDDARSRASTGSAGSGAGRRAGLRKGKWTVEEEEYATRFIHHHSTGLLPLPAGQTLRSALAARLACDPMRITKKYAGASCLGNKISRLCGGDRPPFAPGDKAAARAEMERLERRFHLRVERGPGVPLPEEDPPVSASPAPTSPLPSSTATANAAAQVHSTASVASAVPQAAAAPAPSVASYLAALASNAQLAAAQFRQSSPAASVASTVVTAARAPVVAAPAMPLAAAPAPVATGWPAALPHATPVPPVATTVANNDRLVQTLLLQITAQLQALAALSPSTLRQIQLQILAGTLSASPPPPAPAVPVGADATALLASFQLAAAGQLPAAAPTPAQVQAAAQIQAAAQLPTATPVAGPLPTGLSALLAAHPNAGLQHLLPVAAPVPRAQGLAAGSPTGSSPAAKEPTPVPAQPVPQAGLRHEPAKKRRISVQEAGHRPPVHAPIRTAAPPGAVAHPMAAFLAKLRQGHAEAVARARREQEADSIASGAKVTAKKPTTNPNANGTRPLVALLPYEHATTVSSGSGTTHEGSASGSASSIEALGASDGTRGADGSADSGASSSSDDGTDPSEKSRRSVPPRKRYREGGSDDGGAATESFSKRLRRELSAREEGGDGGGNGGGMTRRNLADHDVRMRMAEMNGGSGY